MVTIKYTGRLGSNIKIFKFNAKLKMHHIFTFAIHMVLAWTKTLNREKAAKFDIQSKKKPRNFIPDHLLLRSLSYDHQ